ncbi:iron-containing redox enzyme family protein [Streptomyces cacaoi]|uniref:iron-containing redox enzyme family protein n=1 Tax=Streptomyces cacaoi TaxID=1898 RepID=UPI000A38828A|nr:iron-containing redox enzyme family protein [Streptomyces cacaoi]NNG89275.1 iron-containing redox enzyme family protein [Streptomyces cacaoi]
MTSTLTRTAGRAEAPLPGARGALTEALLAALRTPPGAGRTSRAGRSPWPGLAGADPYGEDVQLALQLCYELHYRGLRDVDPEWEWDPELLRLRGELERLLLDRVRSEVAGGTDVTAELGALLVEPAGGAGLSRRLAERGTWQQMREYFVHRSVYQMKEADPYLWAVPRLHGRPKAGLVAVEYDEYGAGHAERVHAQLFADLMAAAGLDSGYLHHLDDVPAPALAVVNLTSLFGLHRRWRGALVGHFTAVETTTASSARRMTAALRRLDAPEECVHFYAEHIEADAVHEQVMRRDVVSALLEQEPALAADLVLGIQAIGLLEDRLSRHLETAWDAGTTSLRRPLPE